MEELHATEHEELVRLAAQRSMIIREVMRQAARQLRGTFQVEADQTCNDERKNDLPVPETRYRVLYYLVKDGPLAVSQIAESCRVSVPAISRMLNHLETDGLIERQVDSANRRVIRVVVTDAGRAAESDMKRRFETEVAGVLSPLTDAELADLIAAFGHLERLVANAESIA